MLLWPRGIGHASGGEAGVPVPTDVRVVIVLLLAAQAASVSTLIMQMFSAAVCVIAANNALTPQRGFVEACCPAGHVKGKLVSCPGKPQARPAVEHFRDVTANVCFSFKMFAPCKHFQIQINCV